MEPTSRITPSQPPLNFEHPYLDTGGKLRKKRELGLFDLFVFKMFGCFTTDDLPPTNADETICPPVATKSSSSSVTLASTTATTNNSVPFTVTPPVTTPAPVVAAPPPSQPCPSQPVAAANVKSKRRSSRADARSKQSVWPDKVVESPRIVMERTQFVEQRVEERKRQAQRQRQQQLQATDQINQSISNDVACDKIPVDTDGVIVPAPAGPDRSTQTGSPKEVMHDFRKVSLRSARNNDPEPASSSQDAPTSGVDESMATSGMTGRVSRLSAMFEQQ